MRKKLYAQNVKSKQNIQKIWNDVKNKKNNRPIDFVHVPKTGGTFVKQVLKQTNIRSTSKYGGGHRGHTTRKNIHNINFTVIRHPVDRFESFLNYRLREKRPRKDWSNNAKGAYKDKTISLNEIVGKMTREEILSFRPFKTIKYYTRDVDIFITIDKLQEFLQFFGYKINIDDFGKKNVSPKTRGTFNAKTKRRIARIFRDDMKIYNGLKKKYYI